MLYLALSCLQGRPMQAAAAELWSLPVDGLQLTPGNAPTPAFEDWLSHHHVRTRAHHGFHWDALRTRVWSETADCLVAAESVHPPRAKEGITREWKTHAEQGDYADILLETMYPGYGLGHGADLQWAMDLGLGLVVDVSHIYMQQCQGVLDIAVWKRLQRYDHIGELHLSANQGKADSHQPMTAQTFGLSWLRERACDGIPVVLECYMHRLTPEQRDEQITLVKEALNV